MTTAQTEARAIAARLREDIREEANGYRRQSLKMAADALDTLAAKDAELDGAVFLKDAAEAALRKREVEINKLHAQLAEARKALDDIATLDNNSLHYGPEFARRALTGGGDD